jgi:hypothetical protein
VRKRLILEGLGAANSKFGGVSGVWEVSIYGVGVSFSGVRVGHPPSKLACLNQNLFG